MGLRPHLHLLVPSSTPSIQLEARVYLPRSLAEVGQSRSLHSEPQVWFPELTGSLRGAGIHTVITAAHPWGKLGGSQLDPVLTRHLLSAVDGLDDNGTVVITFNTRGVGHSGGSQGWLGLKSANWENDFAVFEPWALDVFGASVTTLRRVGYSMGSIAAINAALPPDPSTVKDILLISPPVSIFRLTSFFASRSFASALEAMTASRPVTIVYGTEDQFTGVAAYDALQLEGLAKRKIEGADHFWRGEGGWGLGLDGVVEEWLRS